jgi:uncharacterized protein YfaS (alpha-2-macroglobulin family)
MSGVHRADRASGFPTSAEPNSMSVPPSSDPASTEGGPAPRPLERVLGRMDWQPPAWPAAAVRHLRANPKPWLLGVLAVAIVALGTMWALRPQPPKPGALEVQVDAPAPTDYTRTPIRVDDLEIAFSGSAAAIKQVGGAPEGVALSPELPGAWRWVDDRHLSFSPAGDWPVGQHYTVTIEPVALAPKVHLVEGPVEFTTAKFGSRLVKAEFYQDPVEATLKKAVFELGFSHPVDAGSLEPRIALRLEDGAGTKLPAPSFTVTYDDARLKAWVHSQPLQIPENGGKVHLAVDPGVASSLGGPASEARIASQVALPSLYSVAIESASATLVENERYEPEQVLVVEFNNPMKDTDVAAGASLWLLPERNPEHKESVPYPWGEGEVTEAVLKQSKRLAFTALPTEREFSPVHSFRYKAPPGRRLYLRVNRGLKAFGGFILGKPYATVQRVPDYPKLLRFLGDGALLSLRGEQRISLVARNVADARLEVSRLLPDQIQHLAFANSGSFAHPNLWSIESDSLVEREELRLSFPADDPAKAHYEGVELGGFLEPGTRGVYLLSLRTLSDYETRLTPQERLQRNSGSETDNRLVVLTDLGILTKKSLDGSRDVFVQSLARGTPVNGAKVRAIARNGEWLIETTTDASGHARLASLEDFTREKQAVMITVTEGSDFSFLPIGDNGRTLDYSRFDIGGEPNDLERGALDAFVFSDRGLYRPGDAVKLGMIVRAADWGTPLEGLPLELQLVDPRGTTMLRQRFALAADGFGEAGYTPRESAPSGTWQVYLYRIGENEVRTAIGETSFQVREFAPDTMRVQARMSSESPRGWVTPDKLAATVLAENLFGTPATGRRVEGSITLRPWLPEFAQWAGYKFHDPMLAKEGYDEALGDTTTDAEGKAKFDLNLGQYARATYQLAFLARTFEPGSGRAVAAQATTLVSSNPYLVGIKDENNLAYVQRGAAREVRLLGIGPDGDARAVPGLHAVVLEIRHVSVLTKQDSGLYRYVSQERRYPIRDTALDLPAGPRKFALPTDKPGDYALEIRDAEGTVLNQRQWSVAGAANLSRSLDRNAELALSLSKKSYAPGEAIEISVRAPYAGRGLITIERDKVYAHAWFQADTTASVQKITVPADFEGNGYVNVQFLRDPQSDEVFMSPLSYGVLPFAVDREKRTQPISIQVPAVNRPGAEIPVTLTTQGKARVVLFAVDEGILQVARYRVGDPLDHFFTKKSLQVDTAQILDLLLPEFSRLAAPAAPGGDADGGMGKHLNPFKRKAEAPAVWWSGIMEVDGTKLVKFRLPDHFNGRVRLVAVAVTPQRIGIAETSTLLRGDFVLTPTVPTHVAPGDEFELPVGVANTIDGARAPANATVTLKLPKSLTLVGAAPGAVSIAPRSEATVRFRLKAGTAVGAVPIGIEVVSGKFHASRRIEVSLRPAIAWRQQLRAGRAAPNAQLDDLRRMYAAFSTRRLSASPTPLVAIDGLSAYLADYPHLCTEQLLSEGFPALVYAQHPELGTLKGAKDPDGLIAEMSARQNSEGGIGMWKATPDADPFATAYAGLYFVEARERGVPVSNDVMLPLNRYLEAMASDPSDHDLASLRMRAFAVYLLVRQGRAASNLLASVHEQLKRDQPKAWADDVAGLLIAASYQRLQQDKAANPLAVRALARANAPAKVGADDPFVDYYDAGIEQAWTIYLLQRHFAPLARQLKPAATEALLAPVREERYNTLSAAFTVLALESYAANAQPGALPTLLAAGKDGKPRKFGAAQGLVMRGDAAPTDTRLSVRAAADAPAWYLFNESGFDIAPPKAQQANGLEVIRDYLDAKGNVVTALTQGQEVTVRLRVRAVGDHAYGPVAIVDLLPGGFEAVLNTPPQATAAEAAATDGDEYEEGDEDADDATETNAAPEPVLALPGSTLNVEHEEVREDRIVLYAWSSPSVQEFRYTARANNIGTFVVAPVFGEAMYRPSVYAQGGPAGTLTVTAPKK